MFSVKAMWFVDITSTRSSSNLVLLNFVAPSSGVTIIKHKHVYIKQLAYTCVGIRTQSLHGVRPLAIHKYFTLRMLFCCSHLYFSKNKILDKKILANH